MFIPLPTATHCLSSGSERAASVFFPLEGQSAVCPRLGAQFSFAALVDIFTMTCVVGTPPSDELAHVCCEMRRNSLADPAK